MKRWFLAMTVVLALGLAGSTASAQTVSEEYDDSIMHPLRLASYMIHPIGFTVEWLVGRPLHYIISRPQLERVFGYQSPADEAAHRRYGDRL